MNKLLDIKELEVSFIENRRKVNILDGVDLSIDRGQVVAVVGESGSGKTTMAMSIMGLLNNEGGLRREGKILFEGDDLLRKNSKEMNAIRGKHIGMIFQEPLTALNPEMTIGEQIGELLEIHGCSDKAEKRDMVMKVMEDVGLPNPGNLYYYYPSQLSGGMKQRVIIAMSIVCGPKLVIADEPTTALDVTTQAQILSLLKDLKKRKGLSMLFITHDLGVVAEMADQVTVMYCGTVVEYGSVGDIFQNPCHPYASGLMKCMPYVDTRQDYLYTIPGGLPSPVNRPTKGCVFYYRCSIHKDECQEWKPCMFDAGAGHRTRCLRWKEFAL